MDNLLTPSQARKEFFQLIKKVNEDKHPVMIRPTKGGEKGAVIIGEDDWKAIQETLFLVNQGVDKQIKERENDGSGFTDIDDIDWDNLDIQLKTGE